MTGLVLDAGALIAVERGTEAARGLTEPRSKVDQRLTVPSGVLAQVWRGGRGQDRLARFLKLPEVEVVGLSAAEARAVGLLLARARTSDVIDAWVVLAARLRRQPVATTDPVDLRRIDPNVRLVLL